MGGDRCKDAEVEWRNKAIAPYGLDSIFGRIFHGKPVATFPENAP
jgi:hypothetical protein